MPVTETVSAAPSGRGAVTNALWLLVAEIVGKVSNFILVVVVARGLGATDYGYYNFALSFIPLFLIFANWGMDSALVREIAHDRPRTSELLASAFAVLGAMGAIGVGLSLGATVFFVHAPQFYLAVAIIGVALFVDEQAALLADVFKAFEQMKFQAYVVLANRILSMVLSLAAIGFHKSLVLVALAYLIGSLVALVLGRVLLAWRFPPVSLRDVDVETVRWLFRRGVPLALAGFLNMAVYRLDAVMLQGIRGPVEVATYGVAYRFFETFLFFSWTLGVVMLPRLTRLRADAERERTFTVTVGAVVAFYAPLVVCAPFAATFLVETIFSSQYLAAARAVPPLVAATLLYGVAHVGRMGLIAVGRRARVPIAAAVVLALNAALNGVVIPRWGFLGAAWTTFATEVVEAVLLLTLFVASTWVPSLVRAIAVPGVAAGLVAVLLVGFDLHGAEALIVTLIAYPVFLLTTTAAAARSQARLFLSMVRSRNVGVETAPVETR